MPDPVFRSALAPSPDTARLRLPLDAAWLTVAAFAVLIVGAGRLLDDPDTQWHVAVGRRIWEERALPWTDAFSHTFAGSPWIAKEWLSQLVFAAAHAVAGWPGVALVSAFAGALSLGLLQAWLGRRLQPRPVLVLVLLAFVLMAPHLLARPHVLTLPLVVAWTAALVDAAEGRRLPPWWLPLLMALWANLHAGFTIGFALAGLVAAEAVTAAPRDRRRGVAAGWAAMLAACLAAACASPYGIRSILVTIGLFGSGEPLAYIGEWRPLALDLTGWTAIASLGLFCAALLTDLRRTSFRLAALGLLGALMIRHVRFLDLFALAAPVLVAASLLRLWPALAAGPAHAAGPALAAGPGRPPRRLAPSIGLALGAALLATGLARHAAPDPGVTPTAALQAARARGLTAGRVYNSYDFGGFLIGQGVPTFIDGRSDQLFLGGFFRAVQEAAGAADPGPLAALLARHGVTWALVRSGSNEGRLFAALGGWTRVYGDGSAEVFARR